MHTFKRIIFSTFPDIKKKVGKQLYLLKYKEGSPLKEKYKMEVSIQNKIYALNLFFPCGKNLILSK